MIPEHFWIYQSTFWICGLIFTLPMERRDHFFKRAAFFWIFLLAVAVGYISLGEMDNMQVEILIRIFAYLIFSLFLYACWDISYSVAIYNTVWGVSAWQVLKEGCNALIILLRPYNIPDLAEDILILVGFLIGFLLFGLTIVRWMPKGRKRKMGPRQIALTLLIFFLMNVLTFNEGLRKESSIDSTWKYLFLAQVVCLVLLYLEGEMFKKSALRQELDMMNLLRKKEQEQYLLAKENIALINQKCHDLKHQVRAIRKAGKEEIEKYLKEIENSIEIYETIVKTGNDVFDTILTEKSLLCRARQIQVNCVADGSQMDFIETIDLYAVLGNAMDNAIEAVEKLKDPQKRQIDVIIRRQQNFLLINIINPIAEALVFEEGLPVTTKGDRQYHGFGLRSMKNIVKKYGGFLSITEEDGCFSLKILLPIPSTEKATN